MYKPGTPRIASKPQKLEEASKGLPYRFQMAGGPAIILDFGLLASRTARQYISAVLRNPVCGTLLQQL